MPTEMQRPWLTALARLCLAARLPCLAAAALITVSHFAFGATPKAVNFVPPPWDLLLHALLYGTIAFLANIGTGGSRPLLVFFVVCLLGAADETIQLFEPGRHANWTDLLADMLGALAGAFSSRALMEHAPTQS